MVMVEGIDGQDTVNRKTVLEALLNTLDNDVNHILMMGEANFLLCGKRSQNCHYWATENPRLYVLRWLLFGVV
jgi:hypothetical protein